MPPGRKPNLDKRIADLILQLKTAIVAREQQRIERDASAQVESLVAGLRKTASGSKLLPVGPGVTGGGSGSSKGNRKPRSEASKAAQAAKMRAYWKARKAAEAKGGKPKKAKKEAPAAAAAAEGAN